jgi:hypothetical protein
VHCNVYGDHMSTATLSHLQSLFHCTKCFGLIRPSSGIFNGQDVSINHFPI